MKIKDICTSITDGSHNPPQGISESDFLMLSSKNVFDDCITTDEPRYLSKEDYERENKRTRIQPGDVLLTIVGTVGRAAVVPKDMSPFTLQRSVAVLHPNSDKCSSRFLMYALRSKRVYIEKTAKGVAQKGIYLGEVADIDLPVPSIKQQAEITDILDRTNDVIQKRQQQLLAFDDLIKARFVEMFGNCSGRRKLEEYSVLITKGASPKWQGIGSIPLGEFVRSVIGLDMTAAKAAFADYLDSTQLDSRQIYFVNQIVEYIVHNGMMKDLSVLQDSPFTDQGSIVEVFTDLSVWAGIRKAIERVNANAVVA